MDVTVLAGTPKGAFFLHAGPGRDGWRVSGPHFPGAEVYTLAFDGRAGRTRIWAAVTSYHFGSVLCHSDDFGTTWHQPEAPTVKFPEGSDAALKRVWQIAPGRENEPDVLYAGVEPAALFVSGDGGKSFELVRGLWDHPHRPRWEPGGGGLCMHTIVLHPTDRRRIHVAVSAAGVYRSDDGGETWRTAHQGVRAEFRPDKYPEFGQCVHKVVMNPSRPNTMFLQNHFGLYRTDDAGDSWRDIANGVPSDFGFGMAAHPHDPETVYIVPLVSDERRWTADAKLRVYRTHDGGGSWEPLARGLPQEGAYETVLRDALCTDTTRPAGVYFGTRSGKIYGSMDEGESWRLLREGLPPVVCVKTACV